MEQVPVPTNPRKYNYEESPERQIIKCVCGYQTFVNPKSRAMDIVDRIVCPLCFTTMLVNPPKTSPVELIDEPK